MNKSFRKQVEINSAGGMRISIYKQYYNEAAPLMDANGLLRPNWEEPHQITIMPDDDFDEVIAVNNAHLAQMGFPVIDPDELRLPRTLREVAHADPAVAEAIRFQRELADKRKAIDEQVRLDEEARLATAEVAMVDRLKRQILNDPEVAAALSARGAVHGAAK